MLWRIFVHVEGFHNATIVGIQDQNETKNERSIAWPLFRDIAITTIVIVSTKVWHGGSYKLCLSHTCVTSKLGKLCRGDLTEITISSVFIAAFLSLLEVVDCMRVVVLPYLHVVSHHQDEWYLIS